MLQETNSGSVVPKLTPEQAAIVSAYTGYLVGDFSAMHKYVEQKMGGPVFTHQFASQAFYERIREKTKDDFVALSPEVADKPRVT